MKKKMISGEWLVVGMRDEEEDGWWGVVGGGVIDPLLSTTVLFSSLFPPCSINYFLL